MNTAELLDELEAKARQEVLEAPVTKSPIQDALDRIRADHLRPLVEALTSRVDKCYCDRPDGCPHDVSAKALAALHTDLEVALREVKQQGEVT